MQVLENDILLGNRIVDSRLRLICEPIMAYSRGTKGSFK